MVVCLGMIKTREKGHEGKMGQIGYMIDKWERVGHHSEFNIS